MLRLLVLMGLVLLCIAAPAATVRDLYQATVPVASRSERDRTTATRAALSLVLIKLSGDGKARMREGVSPLLKDAQRFVQQYQFVDAPPPADQPEAVPAPGLQLRVQFDAEALNAALRSIGLPIWGKERPSVIAWVAVDDGAARKLLGAEQRSPYARTVTERAAYRGIPLVLPLLDLSDAAALQPGQSLNRVLDPIVQASQRYGTDAILSGSVQQLGADVWEAQWSLRFGQEFDTWKSNGDVAELVLEEGIDGLADRLGTRYARAGAQQLEGGVHIEVGGIQGVDDYARVQRYLSSLDGVSEIFVQAVEPNRVSFLILARGGAEALAQTIALGTTLQSVGLAGRGVYRLLPR